jgi:hypothetical protein
MAVMSASMDGRLGLLVNPEYEPNPIAVNAGDACEVPDEEAEAWAVFAPMRVEPRDMFEVTEEGREAPLGIVRRPEASDDSDVSLLADIETTEADVARERGEPGFLAPMVEAFSFFPSNGELVNLETRGATLGGVLAPFNVDALASLAEARVTRGF